MNCRNFYRNLEEYLDGGLDFAGRFGMERHAEHCLTCGKKMTDARELHRMAVSLVRVKAPMNFEARVCREIAQRKSNGLFTRACSYLAFGFEWRRFAFAAAVCAALMSGIFLARYIQFDAKVPAIVENSGFPQGTDDIENFTEGFEEDFTIEALDLLLVSPNSYHTQEQLPRKIYVRYGPPSEEYFIKKVSH